jgi:pyruvate dehydrogenase E2 component (dihydrolipoamide acetyltransferase)
MSTAFKLPELGEGVDGADVSQIYVSEGDVIEADQPVMQLETDKAVADLPCPHAGTIDKIHVSEGDTIKIGQLILTIEDGQGGKEPTSKSAEEAQEAPSEKPESEAPPDEESEPPEEPPKAKKSENKKRTKEKKVTAEKDEQAAAPDEKAREQREEPPAEEKEKRPRTEADEQTEAEQQAAEPEQAVPEDERREVPSEAAAQRPLPPAGPATRRLARKLGIDLHEVQGTGSSGRITQMDVVEAHDRTRAEAAPGGAPPPSLPDFQKFGPVERQPLNKIARTALKHLSTSWTTVPHVTQHDLADITPLDAARRRYLEGAGQSGPKITLTAIAVKAVTTALKEYPRFNASLDAEREELVVKQYYHIGVAVDTENGLLVPVLRDADRKTILELAAELSEMADRARRRKLGLEQMEGATFTISNQGGIGGTAFTPIVSFPQVAILGMSRARPEWQMREGRPESRLMLPLSLSYDHRVINGADAARFLVRLSAELSDSFQFLIRA